MTRNHYRVVRVSLLALTALALLLWKAHFTPATENKPSLTANIYFQVFDEHNTDAYYNDTHYCTGAYPMIGPSYFQGDMVNGPTTAYEFVPPWTLSTDLKAELASSQYKTGTYCDPRSNICVKVNLEKNLSVLSLDTRQTLGPRTFDLNFSAPCVTCSIPGKTPAFGSSVRVPGYISISLSTPFTSMSVCTSTGCPEAEPAFAKLRFYDPGNPQLEWRVDWSYLRVLRMSPNTWYVIADSCDGTQIAGLYRLQNQRNRTTSSFQGYYLMPFFLTATR